MIPPLTILRAVFFAMSGVMLSMAGLNLLRLTVPGSRAEPLEFLWAIVPGALGLAALSGLVSSLLTEWGLRLISGPRPPAPTPRPVTPPTPLAEPRIIPFPAVVPSAAPTAPTPLPVAPLLDPKCTAAEAIQWAMGSGRIRLAQMILKEEARKASGRDPGAVDLDDEEGEGADSEDESDSDPGSDTEGGDKKGGGK